MLASYARKGVENPVPRRWKWPVLRWPQMAGFGVAAEDQRVLRSLRPQTVQTNLSHSVSTVIALSSFLLLNECIQKDLVVVHG
jgi:hypothetical protein